jgi:hypothetical protein
MYHVNADDLPGNEVSRTFEGGRHGPCSVSFFLVHNQPGQGPGCIIIPTMRPLSSWRATCGSPSGTRPWKVAQATS